MAPVVDVVGVNSKISDIEHILMWDFDDIPLDLVLGSLQRIQKEFGLSNIYVLETKKDRNHIAYCFQRHVWEITIKIIASTKYVDMNFFKYGVYRGKFTLRVSPKCGRKPFLKAVLTSKVPENVKIPDLWSWVKYETLPDNYKIKIKELKVHGSC